MSEFNEQTFLQILRSTRLSDNEYVQKELNVLADLLEEYGVGSPSELKEKIQPSKKKPTPRTKKSKYDLFVEDCALFITNRDAGQNVDAQQIETLVETFQELSAANIKKFAEKFELALSSKKDAPRFKTWIQTGQPPLSESEEKALLLQQTKQQIDQIYHDANDSFTEEQIQKILGFVEGIKDQYNLKELKEFVQTFEPNLTAGGYDKLIEKWADCLRGGEPKQTSKKTASPKAEPLNLENNPDKEKINDLIIAFNGNPTDELKRDTIQKILEVVESVKEAYKFTELKSFVQNVFSSKLTGTSKTLLSNTEKYLKDNLCVPNIPTQENCQAPEESPILKEYVPVQADVTKEIENYVREAVQLRDEKSYELADDNILKIAELAEEVKKAYKIEGLKIFMKALGVNVVNVKNGELINKLVNHLDDVALMRFKAVQMREMK